MLQTNKEIVILNWRNHGPVRIPAGLRVSKMSYGNQGRNVYFVEEFGKVFNPKTHPLQHHDAEYYGLSVEQADVSEDVLSREALRVLRSAVIYLENLQSDEEDQLEHRLGCTWWQGDSADCNCLVSAIERGTCSAIELLNHTIMETR